MVRAYEFLNNRGQIDRNKVLVATKYYINTTPLSCTAVALSYIGEDVSGLCEQCGSYLMCKRVLYNKVM